MRGYWLQTISNSYGEDARGLSFAPVVRNHRKTSVTTTAAAISAMMSAGASIGWIPRERLREDLPLTKILVELHGG